MDAYDYIVVGAGAAGSVLARRLGQLPGARVLVVEAGAASPPPDIDVPYRWAERHFTDLDWAYLSTPQAALAGREVYLAAGRGAGGSTNLYHMIHVRGTPEDYDAWARDGAEGWSWREVLPFFQRAEDRQRDADSTAGRDGPIHVVNARDHGPNPLSRTFIDAAVELGLPVSEDFNARLDGAGWHRLDMRDGLRHGVRRAYLEPALRESDVTLLPRSVVTRVLFDGQRATGIEYVTGGQVRRAFADAEVILCAGAIQSARLLMLSGIGDPRELARCAIPVRVASPGVGRNFHDHALLVAPVARVERAAPPPRLNLSESCLFTSTGLEPGSSAPDIQLGFVHRAQFQPQPDPDLIALLPALTRPRSRGTVRLAGPDPLAPPLLDPAYLTAGGDLERLTVAFELGRALLYTRAFSQWGAKEVTPGAQVWDRAELEQYLRRNVGSYYHYAGTARMGTDETAVVDPQLRVAGVEGLRVADASVMPTLPSGNCHTAVVMIAERAAQFVGAAHGRRTGTSSSNRG